MQGSILGPSLFTIYIEPLLCRLHNSSVAFANDLKLIHEATLIKSDAMQHDVDCLYNWIRPISLEKSAVLHLVANNPCLRFICGNFALSVVTACKDLGVMRRPTVDDSYYSNHVANIMQKAGQLVDTSLRAISSRNPIFLLNMYLTYIKHTINYASQIWNSHLRRDATLIESVQRRFT